MRRASVPVARPDERQAEEIVSLVFAVADGMRSHFAARIAVWDLTPPQAKVLRYLASVGPTPMRDVADGLHCDASYVTGLVDRLSERGLVERQPSTSDRRVKQLVLTRAGRSLSDAVWADVVADAPVVTALDAGSREELLSLLRRMQETMASHCWCHRAP